MTKILYVAPRYHTNQVPIVEYLIRKGHKVQFWVARKEHTEDYSILSPIVCPMDSIFNKIFNWRSKTFNEIQKENYLQAKFTPSIVWTYRNLISYHPDIVIVRDHNILSMVVCVFSKIIGIKNIIQYTQSPCSCKPSEYPNIAKRMIWRLLYTHKEFSPVNVRVSNNEYIDCKNPGRYYIPFAMCYDENVMKRTYLMNSKVRILDVGKYREYKNHFVLIRALSLLPTSVLMNLHVTIVGQASKTEEVDYFNRLDFFVQSCRLDSYVTLLRNIPYSNMNELYLDNDVFVLTSKCEVASISILEAMSNGMVTISTNHNGTASYIPKKFGYTFESDDESSLANVLTRVIYEKNNICQKGLATFEYAKRHYNPEIYWESMKKLCKI